VIPDIPASCTLDETGQREQRARYARLARTVERVRRESGALVVEFGPAVDFDALEEALAVERECCPFFRFAFDRQERRLRTTVDDSAMLPALDAIEHGFQAA
jgi:hypothetical protein